MKIKLNNIYMKYNTHLNIAVLENYSHRVILRACLLTLEYRTFEDRE